MFENVNPMDRSTALLEIGIMLLVAVIIGFLTAWFIQQAKLKKAAQIAPRPAQDKKEKLQTALTALKKKLDEQESAREGLEKELKTLKEKVGTPDGSAALKQQVRAKDAAVAQLEKELGQLKASTATAVSKSAKALKSITEERDKLAAEVKALQAKQQQQSAAPAPPPTSSKPNARLDSLQKEVAALTSQKQALQARLDEAEAAQEDTGRLDRLQNELAAQRAQNAQLKTRLDAQDQPDTRIAQLEQAAQAHQQEVKALQAKLAEEAAALAAKGSDNSETEWLRREKEDQEAEIAELEGQISQLEKDSANWRAKARGKVDPEQTARIQQLEKALATMELEIKQRQAAKKQTAKAPAKPVATGISGPDFSHLGQVKAGEKDDLSKVSGIGPVVVGKLNALGIFTFAQIARLTESDMSRIDDALELFPGRVKREDWVQQAKELGK